MTTTETHKLSAEQQSYQSAKEHYDALNAQAEALSGDIPETETEEEIDAWIERNANAHSQLGTMQARIALHKTQDALLDWGLQQAKKMPGYKRIIEEVIRTKNVHFRERAIEIIMKM